MRTMIWWVEGTKAKVKGTDGCPKVWPPLVLKNFPNLHLLIFVGWLSKVQVTYSISSRCWCLASGQTRYRFLHVKATKTPVGHPGTGSCPILPKWPITPGFEFEISFPARPVTSSDICWFFLFEDIPVWKDCLLTIDRLIGQPFQQAWISIYARQGFFGLPLATNILFLTSMFHGVARVGNKRAGPRGHRESPKRERNIKSTPNQH